MTGVDGLWGGYTNSATKAYQYDHGLTDDGIVGPVTWNTLMGEIQYGATAYPYTYWEIKYEGCIGSFRYSYPSSQLWYVRKLDNTWHASFATWGPN